MRFKEAIQGQIGNSKDLGSNLWREIMANLQLGLFIVCITVIVMTSIFGEHLGLVFRPTLKKL